MAVLIIGGAGYIGSHVAKAFLENGEKTIIFDDLSTGKPENINQKSVFIKGSILDKNALDDVFKNHNIDSVIHLAAKKAVGESMENPQKYSDNNLTGTINILNVMADNNVKNIVFSSSAAVYGMPKYLPIDENHPTDPLNFYGFTKLAIERLLKWYSTLKGIHFAALRYFNAVGYAGDNSITGKEVNPQNLFPIIMETLKGTRPRLQVFGDDYDTKDGTCIRDYIHVTDLASAHLLALDYIKACGKDLTLNLGTSNGISIKEAIKAAEEVTGIKLNYKIVGRRAGDPAVLFANAERAKNILGWQPTNSDIKNIIQTMWNVYK